MSVKIIMGYLKFFNRMLQQHQIDLAASDISPAIVQKFKQALQSQSSDLIEVNEYLLFMQFAQQYFQRPIALVMAEYATLQDLGLVGYLASTSLDLRQSLQLFEQYYTLLYQQTNIEPLQIEQHNESIILKWKAPYPEWQSFYELNLALIYKITETIVENELSPPHVVILGYPTSFSMYHYEKFFRTTVRVQTQQYGINFPIENLQIRIRAADSELNQVLSLQAQNALHVEDTQLKNLHLKVKKIIQQGLLEDVVLQPYVAQHLHCSERTLQRQLKQASLNFQELVDECRYELAQSYLNQGKQLAEIASLLNYADQSAFGRAFKRWSGQTPRQFLQQLHK